jgi:hypothetical protein
MADHGNAPGHPKEKPRAKLDWPATKIILMPWRWTVKAGLEKRLQSLEIYEGTTNPDDPRVQECMENTKRYKKYFAELDGQQSQDAGNEST